MCCSLCVFSSLITMSQPVTRHQLAQFSSLIVCGHGRATICHLGYRPAAASVSVTLFNTVATCAHNCWHQATDDECLSLSSSVSERRGCFEARLVGAVLRAPCSFYGAFHSAIQSRALRSRRSGKFASAKNSRISTQIAH